MRKLHTPWRSGQKRRWTDPHRVRLRPRGRGMLRKQPRRRKFPRAALVLLLLIVAGCTFAAWLTPYEVSVMDGQAISLAPCLAHPLGTDSLGRDLLAMILYGGRLSLYIGLLSALLSSLLALVYGAISGLAPGALDALLMRFCELPAVADSGAVPAGSLGEADTNLDRGGARADLVDDLGEAGTQRGAPHQRKRLYLVSKNHGRGFYLSFAKTSAAESDFSGDVYGSQQLRTGDHRGNDPELFGFGAAGFTGLVGESAVVVQECAAVQSVVDDFAAGACAGHDAGMHHRAGGIRTRAQQPPAEQSLMLGDGPWHCKEY